MPNYWTQTIAGCFVADESRATILDNPSLSLSDPRIWSDLYGGSTDSGVSVTPYKALSYAPVWQAVSMISGDVARLPLMVYRRRWEGDLEYFDAQPDHRVTYQCAVAPNSEETAVDFWARVMVHALIWSNAYIHTLQNGEMVTLLPDRTSPERTKSGELYYATDVDNKIVPLLADTVMHIKGVTINGMDDCQLVAMARNSWGTGLAMEKFQSKFFANGGRIGGILELPLGMPKPSRDQVEEGFRKSYEGADNPFKTVVLRDNAKFHAAQQSPNDAQLVEASEQQVRQVARWFNMPPAKLGLKDASAYNAQEQTNQAYLDQCLAIWLARITAQIVRAKFSEREQSLYTVRHVLTQLLKMDAKKHAETSEIFIRAKIKSPNEVRSELNMLPYDGGSEYGTQAEVAPSPVAKPEPAPMPMEPPSDTETNSKDTLTIAKRRALFSLTYRARRKAENPNAFLTWLDSGWKNERVEWTAIGDGSPEPTFFDAMHSQLQQVASTATADQLSSFVETVASNFEKEA